MQMDGRIKSSHYDGGWSAHKRKAPPVGRAFFNSLASPA